MSSSSPSSDWEAWGAVFVCGLAVVGLVLAEARGSQRGRWLTKPVAALAFVVAAVQWGATDSSYGRLVLAGLGSCALADVLLIPKRDALFLAGLVAFAVGHALYAVAFAAGAVSLPATGVAALLLAAVAAAVWRWLSPHLSGPFRIAVPAYIGIIAVMVALASGASVAGRPGWIALGAWAFAASDLSVARERFVTKGFVNGAWGLPLYFASQLALARSVVG